MRLAAPILGAALSACASFDTGYPCHPDMGLEVSPHRIWRQSGSPALASELLGKQSRITAIGNGHRTRLRWYIADNAEVSACAAYNGPTLYGYDFVVFTDATENASVVREGGEWEIVLRHH